MATFVSEVIVTQTKGKLNVKLKSRIVEFVTERNSPEEYIYIIAKRMQTLLYTNTSHYNVVNNVA